MKRAPNILLISGAVAIVISGFAIAKWQKNPIPYFVQIFGLISSFLGLSFRFFDKPYEKRTRVVRVFVIIGLVLFALVFTGAWFKVTGTAILFVLTTSFIAFTLLPLLTKNRVDKWKKYTRKKWHAYFLSIGDQAGLAALFISYLFRKMHWPGSQFMLYGGLLLLLLGLLAWNRIFSREIVLRKEAEDKVQQALEQLKQQHALVEEKNREILDSIRYARRIQRSLITNEKYIQARLTELQKLKTN